MESDEMCPTQNVDSSQLAQLVAALEQERALRALAEQKLATEHQVQEELRRRIAQLEKDLSESNKKRRKEKHHRRTPNPIDSSSGDSSEHERPNGQPGGGILIPGERTFIPGIGPVSPSGPVFPYGHILSTQWTSPRGRSPLRSRDSGRINYEVSRNVLVVEETGARLQKLEDLLVYFYGYEFVNPYRSEQQKQQQGGDDEAGLVSYGTASDIFARIKGIAAKETTTGDTPVAKSFCSVEMLMNPSTSSAQRIFDLLSTQYTMYQDHSFNALKDMAQEYADILLNLCSRAKDILLQDKLLLTLESPLYVMGDVHGSFHDVQFFLHHLINFGQMCYTANKLLFLGDYVDRGPASLEVAALLLSMKCLTPDSVYLLRGNHETIAVNGNVVVYGRSSFLYQCCSRFGEELGRRVFTAFNDVFCVMPLAAEVDKSVFCVHGGIPRPVKGEGVVECLDKLRQRSFPRSESVTPDAADDPHIARCKAITLGLLWSDPASADATLEEDGYGPNGQRGEGAYVFGQPALTAFLRDTGYEFIIRAHEVKQQGLRLCQSGRVITAFTSSGYCGGDNAAGAVYLAKGKIRMISCLRNWERSLSAPININPNPQQGVATGNETPAVFNMTAQSKVDLKVPDTVFHTCEHCGDVLCLSEAEAHRGTCPEELVRCSQCEDSYPRYCLQKHAETCCDSWI